MFLNTFKSMLKRQLKDRESYTMLMLFPIILILVLGTALGGAFKPANIGSIKIMYLNEDSGMIGSQLDEFIQSEEIGKYLSVQKADSVEDGRSAVSGGTVKAFVHIGPDYTDDILAGEYADINILIQTSSFVDLAVIEGIFDGFNNGIGAVNAMLRTGIEIVEPEMVEATENISVSKNGRLPGAFDYYAVTMLVMTLMYGTLYGGLGIGEVFFENMGKRIHTTPVNKFKLYSAAICSFVTTIFIQGMIILFFTKFVYGAYWGDNIPFLMLIILSMSFFTISLGILVGMIARDNKITVAILQTLVPISTFISSGFFKFQMPDPVIRNLIQSVVPNAMAQTAIFNTIYGGPADETGKLIITMLIAGIIFITGAVFAGRRKLA